MKNKLFSIILLFGLILNFSCGNSVTNPPEDKETPPINLSAVEKKVVSANTNFGIPLFQKVVAEDAGKNVFISPLSVSIALGMALNGASGETYTGIQQTLALNGLSEDEINQTYLNLNNELTNLDPKVQFQIANSIWYNQIFSFGQAFMDVNQQYFNAEVTGLDVTDSASGEKINNWVAEKTHDKITEIVELPLDPDIILYLINAIYFKGSWTYQFDPEYTLDDQFQSADGTSQACKMMTQTNNFQYYEDEQLQAVDLPYGDEKFTMTIILPKKEDGLDAVINGLTTDSWQNMTSNFTEKEGTIQLPKFKLEYEITLNDILSAMGMDIAFTGMADFSRIFPQGGLYISYVKHKTFVEVDEEGTEAAAVTIIGFEVLSIEPSNTFRMRVDRPFLFVIREKENGTLLFMGKVVSVE